MTESPSAVKQSKPIIRSRIPLQLQRVFLSSNRGHEVRAPCSPIGEDNVAFFTRKWRKPSFNESKNKVCFGKDEVTIFNPKTSIDIQHESPGGRWQTIREEVSSGASKKTTGPNRWFSSSQLSSPKAPKRYVGFLLR